MVIQASKDPVETTNTSATGCNNEQDSELTEEKKHNRISDSLLLDNFLVKCTQQKPKRNTLHRSTLLDSSFQKNKRGTRDDNKPSSDSTEVTSTRTIIDP